MTEGEMRAQGYRTPSELLDQAKGNPIVFHKLHMYGQDWFCAPFVKKVIINNPATVILWQDGTKTVCKCSDDDLYDAEKGIAMCFLKKMFGTPSQVRKFINKWVEANEPRSDIIYTHVNSKSVALGKVAYTADTAELTGFFNLVFCKDCKHYCGSESGDEMGTCSITSEYVTEDEFCSKGERRNGKETD